MFNDAIIVQSAVSAFNNAALYAPTFLWSALLATPIFIVAALLRDAIMTRVNWTQRNVLMNASTWTILLTLGWIILMGGAYDVLRDGAAATILPIVSALVVFGGALFAGKWSHNIKMPAMNKWVRICAIAIILLVIAMSDTHAWWGPLVQIAAATIGFFIGRKTRRELPTIPAAIAIVFITTTLILMQPEYFRFGQLGALTPVHLLGIGITGIAAMATFALRNVNPRGRIHNSAYVKLKWMARFIVALAAVLFVMTESVPVFLGLMVVVFGLFAMSIWHATAVPQIAAARMLAITIMMFGIITTMPVVTVLGILCWGDASVRTLWKQVRFLL